MKMPKSGSVLTFLYRLGVAVVVIAGWQYVPGIDALERLSPVFDPFFVSSPSRIFDRLVEMLTSEPSIWPYLTDTVKATFIGVALGTVLGAACGLILSNNHMMRRVLRPYITLLNATPRIALIPIFVIIFGPSLTSTVLTAVAVVFFLVFYNAQAGGGNVPLEVIQNARLLGASRREIKWLIRVRYVLVWTVLSLPNAISFGLIAVVTAEVLTGQFGMGRLLLDSVTLVDSTLTFAVVVVLALVGVALVTAAEAVSKRALHWWEQ